LFGKKIIKSDLPVVIQFKSHKTNFMATKKNINFDSVSLEKISDKKLNEITDRVLNSPKGAKALKSVMRSAMRSAIKSAIKSVLKSPARNK